MKFIYACDIHANYHHLTALIDRAKSIKAQGMIIGGDLIPHHLPEDFGADVLKAQIKYLTTVLIPAIAAFKREHNIPVFLDLGNDDFLYAREYLKPLDGDLHHLLHMNRLPLTKAVDIIGYMCVPPTPFARKDWEKADSASQPLVRGNDAILEGCVSKNGFLQKHRLNPSSGDTIKADLDMLAQKIDKPFIFISHSPPHNTPLDIIHDGRHAGSVSIAQFIHKWGRQGKLIASFHGHIHESPHRSGSIKTMIGNTLCVNPGQNSGWNAKLRYTVFDLTEQGDIKLLE